MEFLSCRVKPLYELVSGLPDVEHVLHVTHTVKALVQHDYAGNIVRVGSTLDESCPHDGVIRIRLFELKSSLAESHRHHDRFPIAQEIRFGARRRKTYQVTPRFLLVLRPQAFAFDVCAARSED